MSRMGRKITGVLVALALGQGCSAIDTTVTAVTNPLTQPPGTFATTTTNYRSGFSGRTSVSTGGHQLWQAIDTNQNVYATSTHGYQLQASPVVFDTGSHP